MINPSTRPESDSSSSRNRSTLSSVLQRKSWMDAGASAHHRRISDSMPLKAEAKNGLATSATITPTDWVRPDRRLRAIGLGS
jgi:hypothetical protein